MIIVLNSATLPRSKSVRWTVCRLKMNDVIHCLFFCLCDWNKYLKITLPKHRSAHVERHRVAKLITQSQRFGSADRIFMWSNWYLNWLAVVCRCSHVTLLIQWQIHSQLLLSLCGFKVIGNSMLCDIARRLWTNGDFFGDFRVGTFENTFCLSSWPDANLLVEFLVKLRFINHFITFRMIRSLSIIQLYRIIYYIWTVKADEEKVNVVWKYRDVVR